MAEVWLVIQETPNFMVSNHGEVKHRHTGKIVNQYMDSGGYSFVILIWRRKRYTRRVHRLVMMTFCPDADTSLEVNHIDGDKLNNSIWNLEWISHADNMKHASRTGLMQGKRSWIRVVETGQIYRSISECARAIDGERRGVNRCLSGLSEEYKGYTFEYV